MHDAEVEDVRCFFEAVARVESHFERRDRKSMTFEARRAGSNVAGG
jgi:hypothetical protein